MACAKVVSQFEVLPVGDAGRRRGWTDEEKVRIVQESLRGYRQGWATARRYGISRSLLTRWRKEHRLGLLEESPPALFSPISAGILVPSPGEISIKASEQRSGFELMARTDVPADRLLRMETPTAGAACPSASLNRVVKCRSP